MSTIEYHFTITVDTLLAYTIFLRKYNNEVVLQYYEADKMYVQLKKIQPAFILKELITKAMQ